MYNVIASIAPLGIPILIWLIIGIVGFQSINRLFDSTTKYLSELLEIFESAAMRFAYGILRLFDTTQVEVFRRLNSSTNWEKEANFITTNDVKEKDIPIIENVIKTEKTAGAFLGIFALAIILFVTTSIIFETFFTLGLVSSIPVNIKMSQATQITYALVGTIIFNGMFLSDRVNKTNFMQLSWSNMQSAKLIYILTITVFILLLVTTSMLIFLTSSTIYFFIYSLFLVLLEIEAAILFPSGIRGLVVVTVIPLYSIVVLTNITRRLLLLINVVCTTLTEILWTLFDKVVSYPMRLIVSYFNKG